MRSSLALALVAAVSLAGSSAARAHWMSRHRHEPVRGIHETYVEEDDADDEAEPAATASAAGATEQPATEPPRALRPPADPAALSKELDERVVELYRRPPAPTWVRDRFQEVVDDFLLRKQRRTESPLGSGQ